jgi:hypothetical protein
VRLVWIERSAAESVLTMAEIVEGSCAVPPAIASGTDWFVNWADVPRLAAESDGDLWASFLVKSGRRTYDYDVHVVRRGADGAWSAARILHERSGACEHGFVSFEPLDAQRTLAVWLDGRDTVERGEHGSMQLLARELRTHDFGPEMLLDPRVCDCCRTETVRLDDGAVLVAYRDRSADETRDISIVTVRDGSASAPRALWDDGWKIAGCPVNGAAIDARAAVVGAAWFTLGAENKARVQVSFSTDRGASFDTPRVLSRRDTDGAVSAAMTDDGTLWVAWLERVDRDVGEWMLAPATVEWVGEPRALARTVVGRAAGIAQLAARGDELVFAWTAPGDEAELRIAAVRSLEPAR